MCNILQKLPFHGGNWSGTFNSPLVGGNCGLLLCCSDVIQVLGTVPMTHAYSARELSLKILLPFLVLQSVPITYTL